MPSDLPQKRSETQNSIDFHYVSNVFLALPFPSLRCFKTAQDSPTIADRSGPGARGPTAHGGTGPSGEFPGEPRPSRNGTRESQEASKAVQECLQSPKRRSKTPMMATRRLKKTRRRPQEASQERPNRPKLPHSLRTTYIFQFSTIILLGFHCVRDSPRRPQDRPNSAEEAPKRAPRRPERAPRRAQRPTRRPKRAHGRPQERAQGDPGGPTDADALLQDTQDGPETAPRAPKTPQDAPKKPPKGGPTRRWLVGYVCFSYSSSSSS